jgi:DNA gyrase/topoisomerase IV subunit B
MDLRFFCATSIEVATNLPRLKQFAHLRTSVRVRLQQEQEQNTTERNYIHDDHVPWFFNPSTISYDPFTGKFQTETKLHAYTKGVFGSLGSSENLISAQLNRLFGDW